MDDALKKKERRLVFIIACILGAVCFLIIYGPYVLNPFYDDWIFMTGERDLTQHYLGFCMYRSSPWQFPIGLVTTASYPHDMSVIYTDAIPLFAFFGKLLNPILPQVFQYLGIYGMISMMLMGGMGALLIYEYSGRVKLSVILSLFYTLAWTMLLRMFYHTSLTSQWLILISLYLWKRLDLSAHTLKNALIFAVFSAAGMLIHPYLWAMSGGILAMCVLEYLITARDIKRSLLYGFCYMFTGVICLYAFGAFAIGKGANLGAGKYEANLNTLFNSMDHGILPGLPVTLLQYEGFGYLGLGILFISIVGILTFIVRMRKPVLDIHRLFLFLTAFIFVLFSIVPEVSLGDRVLVYVDLGKVLGTVVGIFRSNGRFIWPVSIMVMTYLLVFAIRNLKGRRLYILLALALFLQVLDLSPFLLKRHRLFNVSDYEYSGILDGLGPLNDVIDRYDHIVMDLHDGEVDQYLTYYAYLNGMTTNSFYYARPNNNDTDGTLEALRNDMDRGRYDESLLYVIGADELYKYLSYDLHFYEVEGRFVGSHEPLDLPDEYRK